MAHVFLSQLVSKLAFNPNLGNYQPTDRNEERKRSIFTRNTGWFNKALR